MSEENSKIVYGLVYMNYEYFEWEDVVVVSDSKDKLIAHYNVMADLYNKPEWPLQQIKPLLLGDEARNAVENKQLHYTIREILTL